MKSIEQRRQVLISHIQQLRSELENLNSEVLRITGYIEAVARLYPQKFGSELRW